jgi:hypothetical protein
VSYPNAKKRVVELKGFYTHLTVYLLVNLFLFALNMLTSPDRLWFFWPLLGWGIAVALHALRALGSGRQLGAEWQERKINEWMEQGGDQ